MGKFFGIVVVVVGLWAGVEIMNEGSANAFGGLFGRLGMVEKAEPGEAMRTPQRIGAKVDQKHAEADARRERMLAE